MITKHIDTRTHQRGILYLYRQKRLTSEQFRSISTSKGCAKGHSMTSTGSKAWTIETCHYYFTASYVRYRQSFDWNCHNTGSRDVVSYLSNADTCVLLQLLWKETLRKLPGAVVANPALEIRLLFVVRDAILVYCENSLQGKWMNAFITHKIAFTVPTDEPLP